MSAESFLSKLADENSSVGTKYMSIFELKNLVDQQSLIKAFGMVKNSALLKHEICYTLGQIPKSEESEAFLIENIKNNEECAVVRHESAEALANFGNDEYIPLFQEYSNCHVDELKDTCQISLKKLETFGKLKDLYGKRFADTIEPAAPYTKLELEELLGHSPTNGCLLKLLLSDEFHIFDKYRVLYFIRDNFEFCDVLKEILKKVNREQIGALLKHEIFFILGQITDDSVVLINSMKECIEDLGESDIARHEAISAFQSVSNELEFLEKFCHDESNLVKESALVALEVLDYWKKTSH